jgi:hypothetical protein
MRETPTNPSLKAFYWLRLPGSLDDDSSYVISEELLRFRQYATGKLSPNKLVAVRWTSRPQSLQDVVWIGVREIAVSKRLLNVLAPFKGWDMFPVTFVDQTGETFAEYYGLSVVGRSGRVISPRTKAVGEGAQAFYVGLEFDISTWDGSDIFIPNPGYGPIISKPLREALLRNKVTGYQAVRLDRVHLLKAMIDNMWARQIGPFAE